MNVKDFTRDMLVSKIDAYRAIDKTTVKDAHKTLLTSKFYKATIVESDACQIRKVALAVFELSEKLEFLSVDDVQANAHRRSLCEHAKEMFCNAQRIQNECDACSNLSEAIEKQANEIAKLEAKQMKLEAKQAKVEARREAKQMKLEAKQAKQAK